MGRRERQKGVWVVAGVAVAAAGLLIGVSLLSVGGRRDVATMADTERGAERNVWGDAAAPVKLVEYGDYTCVHCAEAWETIEPELEPLIMEGKVQFTFEHFWLGSQDGIMAAVAAQCAADQDKFWAFHSKLFNNQTGGFNAEKLQKFAKELDLDMDAYNSCFDSVNHADEILAATKSAMEEKGIRGTPTFFVNGEAVPVVQSFSEVLDAVKKELGQ